MKKQNKFITSLIIRYLILLFFGFFISLFYKVFTPLTVYPIFLILKIFDTTFLVNNIIIIKLIAIEIIPACVAGSAYFLLLILNLTTEMPSKKRLYSILFSFLALLIINILRIVFLSVLLINEFVYFEIIHKLFWYALSAIFVVGIWFLTVHLFKIKNVPVYTDLKKLIKETKSK